MDKIKAEASKYHFIKLDGDPIEYLKDHWDRSCSLLLGLLKDASRTHQLTGNDLNNLHWLDMPSVLDSFRELLVAWSESLGYVEFEASPESTTVIFVDADNGVSEISASGLELFDVDWNEKVRAIDLTQYSLKDLDFSLPVVEPDSAYFPLGYADYLTCDNPQNEISGNVTASAKVLMGFLLAAFDAAYGGRSAVSNISELRQRVASYIEVLDYIACMQGLAGCDGKFAPKILGQLGWDPTLKALPSIAKAAIH